MLDLNRLRLIYTLIVILYVNQLSKKNLIIDCLLFQFHPESVATHYGRQIFQNFKRITTEFGSQSSLFQERKVHSIGKLESPQVPYVTKYFLHIPFILRRS